MRDGDTVRQLEMAKDRPRCRPGLPLRLGQDEHAAVSRGRCHSRGPRVSGKGDQEVVPSHLALHELAERAEAGSDAGVSKHVRPGRRFVVGTTGGKGKRLVDSPPARGQQSGPPLRA